MDSALTTVQPWKNPGKGPSEVELNKALVLLGFGAWISLEPSNMNFKISLCKKVQSFITI